MTTDLDLRAQRLGDAVALYGTSEEGLRNIALHLGEALDPEVKRLNDRNRDLFIKLMDAHDREGRWVAHLDAIRERLGVREDSRKLGLILRAIDRLDAPTLRASRGCDA